MKVAAFLRGLPAVPAGAGRLLPTRLCTAGKLGSLSPPWELCPLALGDFSWARLPAGAAGGGGGGGPADSQVTSDAVVGEPSRPRRGAGATEGSRLWFETLRGLPGSTWAPGAQAGVGPGLAQHGPWPQASGLRTGGSRGDRRRGCPRRTRSQGVPPMSLLAVFVHALVASCVVTAVLGAATVQSGEKPWLYARPVLDALNALA